jgi:hypothetical protein
LFFDTVYIAFVLKAARECARARANLQAALRRVAAFLPQWDYMATRQFWAANVLAEGANVN